jgi:crotonobetaine/carnitine-CoA ligase
LYRLVGRVYRRHVASAPTAARAAPTPLEAYPRLAELFERRRTSPGSAVLHADERWWTADELGQRMDAAAAAMQAAGIRDGDHVALMLDNSADFVVLFFAVARLGAVAVTVNTGLRGEGLAWVLQHCDARLFVVEQHYARLLEEAAPDEVQVHRVWVRGDAAPTVQLEHVVAKHAGSPAPPMYPRAPDDVAAILYTSGTTGRAKGVMLTDHGYARAAAWFATSFDLDADDVVHTCLPLHHVNAQHLSLCGALLSGARLVLERRFSASSFWATIADRGVTQFNLIGAMLGILHAMPPHPDERRHRARVACVAPTPASIHRDCEERFGVELLDGYGLTETTPGITYNPAGRAREGSCGLPAPHVELAVRAPDGRDMPAGLDGEIVVRERAPAVFMRGYYRDREATAAVLRDGWCWTGDRGSLDEDGFLYFRDRLKDVIRRRGENLSAAEIERAAMQHPDVAEAAVIGVPSDVPGGEEDVALFVIGSGDDGPTPEELVAWCRPRVAEFALPRYVEVIDELPRTDTQRVQKSALRERGVGRAFDRTAAAAVGTDRARA